MKQGQGALAQLALPIRVWASRFAFLLLVGVSVGLIALGRTDALMVERLRTATVDAVAPILDTLVRPVDTFASMVETVRDSLQLHRENDRLRAENEQLLRWQAVARALEAENAVLRSLLDHVPDQAPAALTARIIGHSGGAFVRSMLVNAGMRDGVAKGQVALTSEGLVGRVAEVGLHSARVLLLTDLNSRIPVVVERTRDRAVLAGDNSLLPRLAYLPAKADVARGDRIVTSGHGGIFPRGLPVGLVSAVDGGVVQVQPFVNWDRLEHLRLVDYGLASVLSSGPEAAGPEAAGPEAAVLP